MWLHSWKYCHSLGSRSTEDFLGFSSFHPFLASLLHILPSSFSASFSSSFCSSHVFSCVFSDSPWVHSLYRLCRVFKQISSMLLTEDVVVKTVPLEPQFKSSHMCYKAMKTRITLRRSLASFWGRWRTASSIVFSLDASSINKCGKKWRRNWHPSLNPCL